MAYVLEEGFACVFLSALLGALLFSAASVVVLARAISQAGLERVASWGRAHRRKPTAHYYLQLEQPPTHAVPPSIMWNRRLRLMRQ
jgi:hypothetical protein